MTVARWLVGAGALVLAACGAPPGVSTESARLVDAPTPPTSEPTEPTEPPSPTSPATDPTAPPATEQPGSTAPPATTPPVITPGTLGDRLDTGDAKPARDYDDFVRLALNDIEGWWAEQYPPLYGGPFEPLAGGVYAGYPERTTPIPGCETSAPTEYADLSLYGAFYCADGDFIAYDDGEQGVLYQLASEFGPSIIGVVMAHEYGHAIQQRAGILSRPLPTVRSEQQADCFAGAWVAHVLGGGSSLISFTDEDVRTGLVAMITVRDPIGIDTLDPGGHGSAFDRVGAFQVGFTDGAARCAELIDDPLPLVPNTFQAGSANPDGNSTFDEAIGFIPDDAQKYWNEALATVGATMPVVTAVPVQTLGEIVCLEPTGALAAGATYCPATQTVYWNEPLARDLYDRFGDFVIGYLIGTGYSEAAQVGLSSAARGEDRYLASDCLTGAWAGTLFPENDVPSDERTVYIEPGDLDEAIQAALVVGDDASTDDLFGSGFEKIASFREGVLGGLDSCLGDVGD